MGKKTKILIGIIVGLILIIGTIIYIIKNDNKNEIEEKIENNEPVIIYDKEGNVVLDSSRVNEITEVIKDTSIIGNVELKHNGFIYIYNGQHFGEYGFEMKEYTRANMVDKKQTCIDYVTLEKYDTSYIEEGDLIICSGDLSVKGYSMGDNDFDTKNNSIIVLKSKNYSQMKQEVLSGSNKYSSIITIGDVYQESGHIYIKYSLEDDTHSDTGYNFPFAVKAYFTDNTQVIGDLQRDKKIKVQYEDVNADMDNFKLKSIEVIE